MWFLSGLIGRHSVLYLACYGDRSIHSKAGQEQYLSGVVVFVVFYIRQSVCVCKLVQV